MSREGRLKLFKQDPVRFACYGEEFKVEAPKPKAEPKPKVEKKEVKE